MFDSVSILWRVDMEQNFFDTFEFSSLSNWVHTFLNLVLNSENNAANDGYIHLKLHN